MRSTLALHTFVSIATACFAYLMVLKPLTTIGPGKTLFFSALTVLLWFIILPLVLFINGSADNGFGGEFASIKLISAAVALIVLQALISLRYLKNIISDSTLSIVIGLLLAINILEAVYTQFKSYQDEKKTTDLLNAGLGLAITLGLFFTLKKEKMQIERKGRNLTLQSNIGWWWIAAYSFWNMAFRSHYAENTAWLIFFVVSIVMPVLVQATGSGDWLQSRTVSLVVLLIVSLGLGPGDWNIFSDYDKSGIPVTDTKSPISELQNSEVYIYGCTGIGILTFLVHSITLIK